VKKEGKEIGFVTSAMRSPTVGSVIALAYLKHGFFEHGNNVEVQTETEAIPAVVVALPFYTGT